MTRLEKTTVIRRTPVRETMVSGYNEGPIKSPLSTPQYDSAVMVRVVSGSPQLVLCDKVGYKSCICCFVLIRFEVHIEML